MTYSINYPSGLEDDLEALASSDPFAHARWTAVVDLIYDNDLVARELERNATVQPGPPRFDTAPVGQFIRAGYNISRLKLLKADGNQLVSQRLLYSVDYRGGPPTLILLGLMQRDANYDLHDHIVARCFADYDSLGVPRQRIQG